MKRRRQSSASTAADLDRTLHKSRGRNWAQIHEYYRGGVEQFGLAGWHVCRDFALLASQRADWQSLPMVGDMAVIYVYKDDRLDKRCGYIRVGGTTRRPGFIWIHYCAPDLKRSARLNKFATPRAALKRFEQLLVKHSFVKRLNPMSSQSLI
jgi:hypothetical protein